MFDRNLRHLILLIEELTALGVAFVSLNEGSTLRPMYDNFGRVHQTLGVTPAMEAGLADHVWSIAEIVALLG